MMISAADLLPAGLGAFAPQAAVDSQASLTSWFDDAAAPTLRIGADLGPASRGLTVAQHADRVLGPLLGEPDGR